MVTPWKIVKCYPVGSLFVISVALLCQVLPSACIDLQPTDDLVCYECTSDNPDCDVTLSGFKKECGPDAIGCGIYAFYYDFFIDKVLFHRSCIYSYDVIKPNGLFAIQMLELDDDGYYTHTGDSYQGLMERWTEVRKRAGSSIPVVQVKHAPNGASGVLKIRVFVHQRYGTGGSNVEPFNHWTWPGFKRDATPVKPWSIECYSCEFEIRGSTILAIKKAPTDYPFKHGSDFDFPPCGSKDTSPLKKITCKDAYGCAAFLEMKNASKAMFDDTEYFSQRNDVNNSVARVWRGCWYPGDQECLRYPEKPTGRSLRSGSKGDLGTDQCTAAYKRSYENKDGAVVWAGVKAIESSEEYNKYLKCRHEVREGVNVQLELKLVEDKVDKEYIWIQYLFCGPKSKCNKYEGNRFDYVGQGKYNQKDYEDADGKDAEDEIKKNATVTKFDNCTEVTVKDKEKGAGSLVGGSVLQILLLSAAHFLFLI